MSMAGLKRVLPVAALVAALALMSTIGGVWYTSSRQEAAAVGWVEHTHVAIETLLRIGSALAVAENGLRGFAATHADEELSGVAPALEAAAARAEEIRELTHDNLGQQRRLDELQPELMRRIQLLFARLRAQEQGAQDPGITPETARLSQRIREGLARMVAVEQRLLEQRAEVSRGRALRLRTMSLLGLAISILLILGAAFVMMHERRRAQRAERALRTKHRLLDSIVEGTDDTVLVRDLDGRYLLINTAGARLFGKKPGEVLGKSLLELMPSEVAIPVMRRDEDIIRAGVFRTLEESVVVGGVTRTFLSTKGPYRDPDQRIIGIIGISRDITERRDLEAARLADVKLQLRLGELLQACRVVDEAYQVIEQLAPRFFPAEAGAVYLFHASRDHLEAHVTWGESGDGGSARTFTPDDCWAIRRGQPHFLESFEMGMGCKHAAGRDEVAGGSMLCVPLLAYGEMLGTLHLRSRGPMGEPVRQRAAVLSEQIAMALANLQLREKLRNQSIRDPLTGLFNRRYTEETLTRELHRAERQSTSMSMLAVDVDHFKRFNDTFGHEAGDKVLREIAKLLIEETRGGDVASRMGGEELLVVLPGASLENACVKAERIRLAIKNLQVTHLGIPLGPITVSVGVAAFPEQGRQAEDLLRAADVALYRAKAEGRDRVVMAEVSLDSVAASGAPPGLASDRPILGIRSRPT
ncbi:MAG TPA: diguanylate cyclase [Polyangia bacterium]|jgi:diguanylate cyclase (GGDEF)-like protein/PAS domain S-box-containing protein|nr:diguanylate cyclase [Polyangia bacterium]